MNQLRHFKSSTFRLPANASRVIGLAVLLMPCLGCVKSNEPDPDQVLVWGQRGLSEGQFQTPRAIVCDSQDRIFIVDKLGRIQVFNTDGEFIRVWRTPQIKNGKPVGLGIDNDGNLMVGDTHYQRVLTYTPKGELLKEKTIGGTLGRGNGEFEFLTDVVMDSKGNYFVGEYGDFDRIQKFSNDGKYLSQFGSHGDGKSQFMRPQGMAIDKNDHLWVADACNHRIQVFDVSGDTAKWLRSFGENGTEPGQMRYPYGILLDGKGFAYVCEWGNHRIQKIYARRKNSRDLGRPRQATWPNASTLGYRDGLQRIYSRSRFL